MPEPFSVLLAGWSCVVVVQVEQFFLEVMKIPNYPQRLECWMYKIKFQNQVRRRQPDLVLLVACPCADCLSVCGGVFVGWWCSTVR